MPVGGHAHLRLRLFWYKGETSLLDKHRTLFTIIFIKICWWWCTLLVHTGPHKVRQLLMSHWWLGCFKGYKQHMEVSPPQVDDYSGFVPKRFTVSVTTAQRLHVETLWSMIHWLWTNEQTTFGDFSPTDEIKTQLWPKCETQTSSGRGSDKV